MLYDMMAAIALRQPGQTRIADLSHLLRSPAVGTVINTGVALGVLGIGLAIAIYALSIPFRAVVRTDRR